MYCWCFIHYSCFPEPLRAVIPQAVKSLLLGFQVQMKSAATNKKKTFAKSKYVSWSRICRQDVIHAVCRGWGRRQDQSGAQCMQTTRLPPAVLSKGNVKQEATCKSSLLITWCEQWKVNTEQGAELATWMLNNSNTVPQKHKDPGPRNQKQIEEVTQTSSKTRRNSKVTEANRWLLFPLFPVSFCSHLLP